MLFPAFVVHLIAVTGIFGAPFFVIDQTSGIGGTVYRLSGNHMPAPNRPASRAHTGIKATVCIFFLTSDSQVVRAAGGGSSRSGGGSSRSGGGSPYYQAVLTRLISQVDTDENGDFEVALPPGTYSVFTKKGDLFYATQRDEKNHIAPVKVLPGKITRIMCSVASDHSVVY